MNEKEKKTIFDTSDETMSHPQKSAFSDMEWNVIFSSHD